MSSIHLYIHSQPSCHMHEPAANRSNTEKNLRQDLAALIVLAILERLLQAAKQGGDQAGHAPANGGSPVDKSDKSHAAEAGSNAGDKALGVLKPFLELLLLLALLCKHDKGQKGGANPVADKVAERLDDGNAPQGLAQDGNGSGDESNAMEDAVSMMVSAMREGRKDSLLKDDKAFESQLDRMSTDLREDLAPEPEPESQAEGDTTAPADDTNRPNDPN